MPANRYTYKIVTPNGEVVEETFDFDRIVQQALGNGSIMFEFWREPETEDEVAMVRAIAESTQQIQVGLHVGNILLAAGSTLISSNDYA